SGVLRMTNSVDERPRIALTMGDVAGIGPELIARVAVHPEVRAWCRPVVVGDPDVLERACDLLKVTARIVEIDQVQKAEEKEFGPEVIPCWNPGTAAAADVPPGRIDARAGQAAYEWLVAATQAALDGDVDAIVTA